MTEKKTINRYEIRKQIGQSGIATTFLVFDPDVEKEFALKLFNRGILSQEEIRAGFIREARVISFLENPGIVQMLNLGEFEDQVYIVSEYLTGGSLADRMTNGPLSVEEARQIFNQLAPALEAVHELEITHQNLKPNNILFDEKGIPHLADFAIHQVLFNRDEQLVSPLVQDPAYMSPEQILGETIDHRSDIYALGMILFELLSGKRPFNANTPVKIAKQHLFDRIPDILELVPGLPPELDAVLRIALAKEPKDRFVSVGHFSHVLDQVTTNPGKPLTPPLIIPVIEQKSISWLAAQKPAVVKPSQMEEAAIHQTPPSVQSPVQHPGHKKAAFTWISLFVLLGVFIFAGWITYPYLNSWISNLRNQPFAITQFERTPDLTNTSSVESTLAPETPTQPVIEPSATEVEATKLAPSSTVEPVLPTDPPPTEDASLNTQTSESMPSTTLNQSNLGNLPYPGGLIKGGADKLAFIASDNNIRIVDLDGNNLERLTDDGTQKFQLRWTPDGKGLLYRKETGFYIFDLVSNTETLLGNFNDLDISPDMQSVVLGDFVDYPDKNKRWRNYLVSYDFDFLRKLRLVPDANCQFEAGRLTRFSPRGDQISSVVKATIDGRQIEVIRLFTKLGCGDILDNRLTIPKTSFLLRGYNGPGDSLTIDDYSWDGYNRFAITGKIQDDFGDLMVWDAKELKGAIYAPVQGKCCYRFPRWSPDGQYILVAFQDIRYRTETQIYYFPTSALGSVGNLFPIPLPDFMFTNPRTFIEPSLRIVNP